MVEMTKSDRYEVPPGPLPGPGPGQGSVISGIHQQPMSMQQQQQQQQQHHHHHYTPLTSVNNGSGLHPHSANGSSSLPRPMPPPPLPPPGHHHANSPLQRSMMLHHTNTAQQHQHPIQNGVGSGGMTGSGVTVLNGQMPPYETHDPDAEKWWWVCCLEFCFCLL